MNMNKKEKQYCITVSESQLRMIANCVEDCSRFMAGDMDLQNCTSVLDYQNELQDEMKCMQHYVTVYLQMRWRDCWDSGGSKNINCVHRMIRR